jgi:hypothetical protein
MRFKKFLSLTLLIGFLSIFSLVSIAQAQSSGSSSSGRILKDKSLIDAQSSALAEGAGFDASLELADVVALIIEVALSLLALVFLIFIIIGGYQWLTAGGNKEQVDKAVGHIKNAVIGLIIVLLAYAITTFVFKNLPSGGAGTTITSG